MEMKEIKQFTNSIINFLKQKKVQNIIVTILFLLILFAGAYIRTQNLPNLIDPTTKDYTPLALDPYYFLRISETLLANGGLLSEVDNMRYPALEPSWSNEILPQSTVLIYKVMNTFNSEVTLRLANVLNPVIFFVLGIIVFFFLVLMLTKNKWIATISTGLLTIIPPYLYRTMAGFSDHEAIGMFGFFLALLSFSLGIFYLEKKKLNAIYSSLIGLVSGFLTMFAIASWGGGAKFLFMILPLAFIVIWFTKKDKSLWNYVLFYGLWILGVLITSPIFGYEIFYILKVFMLNSAGILTFLALGYSMLDTILIKTKILPKKLSQYRELFSLGGVIILSLIFYQILIGNAWDLIVNLINRIIYPFGTERVGLTVAENKQPYLNDWISQVSKIIFYTFLLGCFIVGTKLAKGIKKRKYRPLFIGSFFFFVMGILFSRISASSILNGENFLSKALFFISFLVLAISSIYIYSKSDWEIESKWIIIVVWMVPMLLAVRSAIRVFFAIVPFVSFMIPLTLFEIGKFAKKSKDDLIKMISYALLGILIIGLISTSFGFYNSVSYQAKNQYPSYNADWQKAMGWVRNNTAEGSIFLHWWDYGYWMQTGGQRPSVTDGGHFNGYWDHLIGRYILTTPYPETAKSFMKAHNVSYLLIDPTDIGKYSAYSSIGDNKEISDRASWMPTLLSDPKEIQETREGIIKIYRGGHYLDSDIVFEDSGKEIFLPKGKAALAAIILEKTINGYSQPTGIFVYNSNQYKLPLRYVASEEDLFDFNSGIESTVYLYPNVIGQQFELDGALMYLSEKTMNSLVAKLYLMNDPLKEYPELKLVHSEGAYQFNFYYNGFRGPIKIWEVDHSDEIIAREEFLRPSGEYGEFDDLEFVR